MNRDKQAEAQILGQPATDTFTAKFYLHKVKNLDTPETREAMRLADEKAKRKTNITGKYAEPDYTPANLIKLGAREEVKTVPYVLIKRLNAKDSKSSPVTEEHKQQFPNEWAEFEKEHYEDIYKERNSVRTTPDRPVNSTQSANWQGGVNYTPTPYTISFG